MVLPIYLYGNPVLKVKGVEIDKDYPGLSELIANMWDTMYFANGVGLAAPQVGYSIRLFVVDSTAYYDRGDQSKGLKKVFINPKIIEETGTPWSFEEGCLSIPKINAEVERTTHVRLRYLDEHFKEQLEEFDEMNARIIQHEYDHIEGVLFIDRIKPFRKQILQRKLDRIRNGQVEAKYPVKS